MNRNRFAIVIPVYNHKDKIKDVILDALKINFPVIVVDDGSTDGTYEKIRGIKNIKIIRHKKNMGKGAAIMTGLLHAAKTANWAITLDGDGQHNPYDIPSLIKVVPNGQRPVIIGKRYGMDKGKVPWTSRWGRKFSNFWVWVAGGAMLSDSQSGFRIYPLPETLNLNIKAKRFQYEVEVLVKAGWKNIPVIEAPVSVTYKPGCQRVSHFRPFVDFIRNNNTFTRLIFRRIMIPKTIRQRW